ncbi:G protein-coupled glucose receptor regulating Gpa2-domain-containing protein [Xylaria sp. FL0064]|nr:G protein-coupled glucose receptor regulating Gpa2-domain-containing protein [Xylaria sp. FL0064]
MAPLQQLTAATTTSLMSSTCDGFIVKRNAQQGINTIKTDTLAVMYVSLAFAAISVITALVTFYWFVRMRRGFRQDMIMLLIQSDMAKALWLLISPLYYFISKKPLNSSASFCQVSGFLLAVSIEASDIAVLLIAIHTTLFVVKRQHPGANFGFQPYRRIAYTLWATVPIILAAIVPITGNSFVDNGPYCYLPIRPVWYRETLAWVPRYIVFGFIIVTYTGLYLYVYIRFRRFGEDQRRASIMNSVSSGSFTHRHSKRKWGDRSVPPTPHLTTHGLLDPTRISLSKNDAAKLRQYSLASTVSTLQIGDGVYLPIAPDRALRRSSIAWNLVNFGHEGTMAPATINPRAETDPNCPTTQFSVLHSDGIDNNNKTNDNNDNNGTVPVTAAIPAPEPAHVPSGSDRDPPSPYTQRTVRHNRWKRQLRQHDSDPVPRDSLASIRATLRQGPPRRPATTMGGYNPNDSSPSAGIAPGATAGEEQEEQEEELSTAATTSSSSVYLPTEESWESMRGSRDRMKRQIRLLFVYPTIYLLTWIAPFVAHAYRYEGKYASTGNSTTSPGAENSTTTDPSNIIDSVHQLFLLAAAASSTSTPSPSPSPSPFPYSYTSYPSPESLTFTVVPLPLRIISMVSFCIGAAVDCAFFSAWEQPWRHLRGSFWENMVRRLDIHRILFRGRSSSFAGRTRDERVADGRAARIRRQREETEMGLALRWKMAHGGIGADSSGSTAGEKTGGRLVVIGKRGRGERSGARSVDVESGGGAERRRREWWDALDEATL